MGDHFHFKASSSYDKRKKYPRRNGLESLTGRMNWKNLRKTHCNHVKQKDRHQQQQWKHKEIAKHDFLTGIYILLTHE
ncbi:hypothetical protein LEMLEM_LOCUS18909 [Lemmus lemmus]